MSFFFVIFLPDKGIVETTHSDFDLFQTVCV